MVDGVVEEQNLGRLDEDGQKRQKTVVHQHGDAGGKKLIYTHVSMPLTAIDDFRGLAAEDPRFGELAAIVEANNGLWCVAAERYLLDNWDPIDD